MRYIDFLPGDIIIREDDCRLVISMNKLDDGWTTFKFVKCYDNEMEIYVCDYATTWQVAFDCRVIRSALRRHSPRRCVDRQTLGDYAHYLNREPYQRLD